MKLGERLRAAFRVQKNNEPVEQRDILLPRLPTGARLLQHVKPEHKRTARGHPAAGRYATPAGHVGTAHSTDHREIVGLT
jgi:hypothetical protein